MIYIITHKKFDPYFQDPFHYKTLQVGNACAPIEEYLHDSTGDNISFKNPNYCELTGLYWMWKNDKESPNDITGLVHYRRYFTNKLGDFLYTYFNIKPRILKWNVINNKLKSYDAIMPTKDKIFNTVRGNYTNAHGDEDLDLCREAIEESHPEYLYAFDNVMNAHAYYYANMIICKKQLLDQYCEWLFSVMDVLEHKIDLNKYKDAYQRRVFGFLSERLLQVYVEKNQLKVKEFPVFNTESRRVNVFQKNFMRLRHVVEKLGLKR